jgi:hypothetical protein
MPGSYIIKDQYAQDIFGLYNIYYMPGIGLRPGDSTLPIFVGLPVNGTSRDQQIRLREFILIAFVKSLVGDSINKDGKKGKVNVLFSLSLSKEINKKNLPY